MKIERINENQIRCTLNDRDLSARDLDLSELAYGTEKARNLFREMIQKASNEVGFDAEDIPLMVEAIPLSSESVMLVITKIEDPEELDTRFAKFSPMSDEEDSLLSDLANELLEGADGLLQYLRSSADPSGAQKDGAPGLPSQTAQTEKSSDTDSSPLNDLRVFTFSSLDLTADAAKVVEPTFSGQSILYKNPRSGQYYLVLHRNTDDLEFSRSCNVLAEYGAKIRHDHATEAYFEEHYEVIIKKNAIQALTQL